ncbi:MAG: MBL fold metallo-hydrolase [Candidatus Nanohaloarchaeota archaeon]|nr:MBL fold metallo-hydrolase [Candidatus Nanohaloarchaeota archaeon]
MGCFKYGNVEMCLIGHASVKLKTQNFTVYIDPYANLDSKLYEDKADYVLITHEHFDHCSLDALKKVCKENCTVVVPKNSKCSDVVKEAVPNAELIELSEGETADLPNLKITAVPAYNTDKPYHPRGLGIGYVVNAEDVTVYHPGDTDFIPEMESLKGKVDVFFVPISGVYVMDEFDAVKAVKTILPKIAVPMHYNYLEGLEKDAEKFAELVGDVCEVKVLL